DRKIVGYHGDSLSKSISWLRSEAGSISWRIVRESKMQTLPVTLLSAVAAAVLLQGCASTQPPTAPRSSAAPLNVVGSNKVIEIAPVVLAVREIQPEGPPVQNGFVANLVAETAPADVAGNSETQLLRYSVARPDLRI